MLNLQYLNSIMARRSRCIHSALRVTQLSIPLSSSIGNHAKVYRNFSASRLPDGPNITSIDSLMNMTPYVTEEYESGFNKQESDQ